LNNRAKRYSMGFNNLLRSIERGEANATDIDKFLNKVKANSIKGTAIERTEAEETIKIYERNLKRALENQPQNRDAAGRLLSVGDEVYTARSRDNLSLERCTITKVTDKLFFLLTEDGHELRRNSKAIIRL